MIIKSVEIEKFRALENVSFCLGKYLTAISGRNATQKTTLLGLIGQPFTISKTHPMYGCKTVDGYNFRSQFKEKFKISPDHDTIGSHKWTLNLHNNVHSQNYYTVESIARRQSGRTSLRFWNAESRSRGAGYIQLPVYYLSLSRLFPIGESGKTKAVSFSLTPSELNYCITNYRNILSIQHISGTPEIGIEKGSSSKTYTGVSDNIHDIFTNSAGEGNITRIILAVLSFKRLKEQYCREYKGGILLIDEIDATLHGFSQNKLIDYLWKSAEQYQIQIIFTTHSPIILKCINKYQRKERHKLGTDKPLYAYNSSIVYLQPQYADDGTRTIVPQNISTSTELYTVLNDINLSIPINDSKLNIYCEDNRSISFVQYLLASKLNINLDLYMTFIDINLGWTNYVQLANKNVPEFIKNIIILDGDVPTKPEYNTRIGNKTRRQIIEESGNFIFLPLLIEQDLFILLKNHSAFSKFQQNFSPVSNFTYDVCFNNWPLEPNAYNTDKFKEWYNHVISAIGDQNILFDFWCSENPDKSHEFIENFIKVFNKFAEKNNIDSIPESFECAPED